MSTSNKIVTAKQSADDKSKEKNETNKDQIRNNTNSNQKGAIIIPPHFADREKDNTTDPKISLNSESEQSNPAKLSFADALKKHQTINIRNSKNSGNAERIAIKEEIHARIFQTTTFTPDQSPQGIEKKVTEIQLAIQKAIGPGGITSIQYTGKGQYTVELKSKELVQQILQTGLQFPGETQNAPSNREETKSNLLRLRQTRQH